jgi:hypothetical protein
MISCEQTGPFPCSVLLPIASAFQMPDGRTLAADLETRIVRLLDENRVSARRKLEALRYGIAIAQRN